MNRLRRKCRKTDCNVLGAFGVGRTVADPFSGPDDDRLTRMHLERRVGSLDAEHSTEHHRYLFKLRLLRRLFPAARRHHAGDADGLVTGTGPPGILLDPLGLVSGGLDYLRFIYESGHR